MWASAREKVRIKERKKHRRPTQGQKVSKRLPSAKKKNKGKNKLFKGEGD